ncbi:MAG: pancreas/duodenum homeobox protein 1 [Desulfovibrionales bacterium]|nr:MAG: pancreas/duodenum homeobox protein 1 [Desulfovibrionales bacterium]
MQPDHYQSIFSPEWLEQTFPVQRSADFFEALYGDADEAAFDIKLAFDGAASGNLYFQFQLVQRPGKCLACNLTYGLPNVLTRHPVINMRGLVADIASALDLPVSTLTWNLGQTDPRHQELHVIPLTITISAK